MYKFDRVSVNNSQQATDHLNKAAKEGWKPIFFFDMGSHSLGVVFERGGTFAMPLSGEVQIEKRGPGRPKKVVMEG